MNKAEKHEQSDWPDWTLDEDTTAPSVAPSQERPFIKVPNEYTGRLLDGGKASIYALHLLAIKIAGGEDFVLNEKHVSKRHGIGRRALRSGLSRMKACDVLDRRQAYARKFARERLAPVASHRFTPLPRDIISEPSDVVAFTLVVNLSRFQLQPMAAAKRIGITCDKAVARIVARAVELDAIEFATGPHGKKLVARKGASIQFRENVPGENVPGENVPAHNRRKGSEGDVRETCQTKAGIYVFRPEAEKTPPLQDHLDEDLAWSEANILGWALDDDDCYYDHLRDISQEALADCEDVLGDQELIAEALDAAGGRIHRDILNLEGAYGLRVLAAHLVDTYSIEPADAIDQVLLAIKTRVGDKPGTWLNSLKLIGVRICWQTYNEYGSETFSSADRMMADIVAADGARILSSKLLSSPRKLIAFVNQFQDRDEALRSICRVLRGAMVGGGDPGSIRTWHYFNRAIQDDAKLAAMSAKNVRPGDVFCWHRSMQS